MNDIILKNNTIELLPAVTRVEIIEHPTPSRKYTNWDENNKVELSLQDNGKTLKIFITNERSNNK